MKKTIPLLRFAAGLFPLILSACIVLETSGAVSSGSESVSKILDSISDSVKSISRSIEGSSESSSGDSDEEKERSGAFFRDVRALVAVCAREDVPANNLMREIGALARSHGIPDWEALDGTIVAIGNGLQEGGLKRSDYAILRGRLIEQRRTLALLDQGYGY